MAADVFEIVGQTIAGAYRVDAVVAEGGFGVVYKAYHAGFRAPVALKCLKIPEQFGPQHQAAFLEQFRAEAELLFRLSASIPTVVRPLHVDALTARGGRFVPFMALEWLDGVTLEQIATKRKREGKEPLALKKLVRMLTPVARALERAHNFSGPEGPISIVHRDMKPENIFVARVAGEEIVKILDFGIGKAKSVASQVAGRASQQSVGVSSFTPAYGAPEQWLPKRFGQTGPWTDVWGLALTLVEVAVGRPIIDGDQAAMMGTTLDPTRRPTPRSEGLSVSDDTEAAFQRALALDPRDRFADAGEFWNALCDALDIHDASAPLSRLRDPRAEGGGARVESLGTPAPRAATPRASQALDTQPAAEGAGHIPDLVAAPEPPRAPPPGVDSRRFAANIDLEPSTGPSLDLDLSEPLHHRSSGGMPAVRQPPRSGQQAAVRPGPAPAGWADADRVPASRAAGRSGEWAAQSPRAAGRSGEWAAQGGAGEPRSRSSGQMAAVRPGGPGDPGWPGADRPPPPPPANAAPDALRGPVFAPAPPEQTLVQRLLPGLVLCGLSLVLTIASQVYSASSGEVFSLGPIRAGWVTAALLVGGLGWIASRFARA